MPAQIEAPKINSPLSENNENKPKRMGILEGAMENVGQTFLKDEPIVAQMKDDTLKQLEEMGLITMEDYDKLKLENIKSDNQKTEEEPKNDTEELQLEEVEAIKIDEISPIAIDEDVPEKNEKSVASEMQTQPQEQNITPQVQENPGFQQIPSIQPQFQPSQTNIQEQPEDQNLVQQPQEIIPPNDESVEFDDMSLLSESYEAQEKFREYIVSELSKKNVDLTPKSNEFKLDISERTLSMIARSMAKKIAKHVNNICTQGTTNQAQIAEIEEKNKKLRILLAETNKNLNSYKPSIFGLYKKVTPKKKK